MTAVTREQFHAAEDVYAFGHRQAEWVRGRVYVPDRVSWPHVVAARNTADVLQGVFAGQGFLIPRGAFITDYAELVPDLNVAPGRWGDYTDHPKVSLLMVEVSGATLDRDTTIKAEIYATAGIVDYWVLDLENRRLLVFRDPQPIPDGGSAYRTLTELGESDTVSPLAAPGAQLRVADLLP